jgi:hypothetical protein
MAAKSFPLPKDTHAAEFALITVFRKKLPRGHRIVG